MRSAENKQCWFAPHCVLQAHLQRQNSSVRVDAMLFAPPNVGDKAFADAYGAVVNGRRCAPQSRIQPQSFKHTTLRPLLACRQTNLPRPSPNLACLKILLCCTR